MLKKLYFILGFLSLSLGIIGIYLPGLPTTPFLLLSAYLFSRCSPKIYKWLLENKYLGKYIAEFECNKAISPETKTKAIIMIIIMIAISIFFFIKSIWIILIVAFSGLIGILSLLIFVPTLKNKTDESHE